MSKRTDTTRQAIADLQAALTDLPAAERVMRDAIDGHAGAASYDGPHSRGGSSSPVEALAVKHFGNVTGGPRPGQHGDKAAAELAHLEELVARIGRDALTVLNLVRANAPHAPSDKDRRDVERVNTAETLCQHCTDHRRTGDAQPVHRTGTVNGNLPHPMALCRWCYDRVRQDGRLPSGDRLERLRSFKADAVRA